MKLSDKMREMSKEEMECRLALAQVDEGRYTSIGFKRCLDWHCSIYANDCYADVAYMYWSQFATEED